MAQPSPLVAALAQLLEPLNVALTDRAQMAIFLENLGWKVTLSDAQFAAVRSVLALSDALGQAAELTANPGASEAGARAVDLGLAVFRAIEGLSGVTTANLRTLPQPLDDPASWPRIALELPEFLLLEWLSAQLALPYALLVAGGVVTETPRAAGLPPRRELSWSALGQLLADPADQLARTYGWGGTLDHGRLITTLAGFARAAGLEAARGPVRDDIAALLPAGSAVAAADQLELPVFRGTTPDGRAVLNAALVAVPVSDGRSGAARGLWLTNVLEGTPRSAFDLGDGWTLQMEGSGATTSALAVRVLPEGAALAGAAARVGAAWALEGRPSAPWMLLGSSTGTRLEAGALRLWAALAGSAAQPELVLGSEVPGGARLVITPGDGDGLVRQLLGSESLGFVFGLGLEWSSVRGLQLTGGTGLCVTLPMSLRLGPATLDEVHLCLSAGNDSVALFGAVTAHAQLGPVVCSVKEIGVEARLAWDGTAEAGQRCGTASLQLGFKPPSGLGLGIEAPGVTAGGYLEFDRERGEYGGTATLGIGPLALTAVGLLDTKLPEPPGWSLLLSICAEFVPVPLGFGFTLNGVGGLVGIGRTVDTDALQRQLFAGALDAVMFPEDAVGNGPAIIETIRTLFPAAPGQTVFGPMVKVGWGAPTLIDADLGVMIELPDPVQIVVVGQIASELPTRAIALMRLHLDAFGAFNLTTLELTIAASLYDSWFVGYTLSGDMAIRASFGAAPNFLLAVGGFNPRFKAPPAFPKLRPMAIGLRFDADLRIEAQSYFALTTNTIQFGARIVVVAKLRILTLEGGTSFDALITYSPFSFAIGFDAWVDVLLGSQELLGVSIDATLRGPEPWFFSGEASFRVLGKEWRFDVAVRLAGNKMPVDLEPVDVAALVRAALRDAGAWTQPTSDSGGGVRLAPLLQSTATAAADALPTLLLRPDLSIEVRQRVAPLGVALEKFGNQTIQGPTSVAIERATFGSVTLDAAQLSDRIDDWFAPGEYFKLDTTEKITGPSFELLDAGHRMLPSGFVTGSACERSLAHEFSIIDRDLDRKVARRAGPRKGGTTQAADAEAVQRARRPPRDIECQAPALRLGKPAWQVVDTDSAWTSADIDSFAAARTLLTGRQRQQPHLAGRLRVVPATAKEPT